jgi:hypothetical protein
LVNASTTGILTVFLFCLSFWNSGKKRNAPSPGQKVAFRQSRRERKHRRRGKAADRIADLDEAAEQTAPLRWCRFRHQQHSTAPFAAKTHGLEQPQHDEEDRREDADLLIGRQQTHKERAKTHQQHRKHE